MRARQRLDGPHARSGCGSDAFLGEGEEPMPKPSSWDLALRQKRSKPKPRIKPWLTSGPGGTQDLCFFLFLTRKNWFTRRLSLFSRDSSLLAMVKTPQMPKCVVWFSYAGDPRHDVHLPSSSVSKGVLTRHSQGKKASKAK